MTVTGTMAEPAARGTGRTGAVRRLAMYLSVARMSARGILAYRASFVFGYFGVFFQVTAMFALWRALLANGSGMEGFTWDQMKAYLLVVFVTTSLVSVFGDFSMANRIRDGMVAVDLTRPMDYQYARFAEMLGRTVIELAVALSIAAILGAATGAASPTPVGAVLFTLSLVVVVPLKFIVVYLSSLLCFWTQSYLGVLWARTALVSLLSGALVPLVFLPGWLQALAVVLPFVGMTATPAGLYLGRLTGSEALVALAAQIGWTIALWWLARLAFARAVRQVTVHGG
jgi:ABC-2 type transport system permease protein